jgi:thioredoxin 1
MVSPIVDEVAAEHADSLKVVKLNVDDNPDIARRYRVMSIPTLMVFAEGDERKRIVGARGKTQLVNEVSEFI